MSIKGLRDPRQHNGTRAGMDWLILRRPRDKSLIRETVRSAPYGRHAVATPTLRQSRQKAGTRVSARVGGDNHRPYVIGLLNSKSNGKSRHLSLSQKVMKDSPAICKLPASPEKHIFPYQVDFLMARLSSSYPTVRQSAIPESCGISPDPDLTNRTRHHTCLFLT